MPEGEILTNLEFDYPFGGRVFKVKKATLRQVMDFQRKATLITGEKDAAADLRLAAYAIYLILYAVDTNINEDWVIDNAPGNLDVLEVISQLGFLNQQKVAVMNRLKNSLEGAPISPSSGEGSTG